MNTRQQPRTTPTKGRTRRRAPQEQRARRAQYNRQNNNRQCRGYQWDFVRVLGAAGFVLLVLILFGAGAL